MTRDEKIAAAREDVLNAARNVEASAHHQGRPFRPDEHYDAIADLRKKVRLLAAAEKPERPRLMTLRARAEQPAPYSPSMASSYGVDTATRICMISEDRADIAAKICELPRQAIAQPCSLIGELVDQHVIVSHDGGVLLADVLRLLEGR